MPVLASMLGLVLRDVLPTRDEYRRKYVVLDLGP